MFSILLVLLIIVSVFMIGLILLQKSEGSGMSGSSAASMFGGVLTGASAGNFLTKTTAWLATIFFILCAMLAIVASKSDISSRQSELRQELMQGEPSAQSEPVAPQSEKVTTVPPETPAAPAQKPATAPVSAK